MARALRAQLLRRTRLLVATEGILTARLQQDPLLSGFRTIVLDEFHERSIHADLGIALARQAWRARDDLRIVVMSATLDAQRVAAFLGDCPVFDVPGACIPLRRRVPRRRRAVAGAVARSARPARGSGAVFPARRAARLRRRRRRSIRAAAPASRSSTLHGIADRRRTGSRASRRHSDGAIIVATNIAETSLTVPGVRAVIDTGLHKVARYDADRGDRQPRDRAHLARFRRSARRARRPPRPGHGAATVGRSATGCSRTGSPRFIADRSVRPGARRASPGAAIRGPSNGSNARPPQRSTRRSRCFRDARRGRRRPADRRSAGDGAAAGASPAGADPASKPAARARPRSRARSCRIGSSCRGIRRRPPVRSARPCDREARAAAAHRAERRVSYNAPAARSRPREASTSGSCGGRCSRAIPIGSRSGASPASRACCSPAGTAPFVGPESGVRDGEYLAGARRPGEPARRGRRGAHPYRQHRREGVAERRPRPP